MAKDAIMCDYRNRWAPVAILAISVLIPLGGIRRSFTCCVSSRSGVGIYGFTLVALAIAALWTAFVVVACIGAPVTGLMYLLVSPGGRARQPGHRGHAH
jgi:hypothetical protein